MKDGSLRAWTVFSSIFFNTGCYRSPDLSLCAEEQDKKTSHQTSQTFQTGSSTFHLAFSVTTSHPWCKCPATSLPAGYWHPTLAKSWIPHSNLLNHLLFLILYKKNINQKNYRPRLLQNVRKGHEQSHQNKILCKISFVFFSHLHITSATVDPLLNTHPSS